MSQARVLLIIISLFSLSANSQQLIINEVSQGTGSGEYVEFVVTGEPTCQTPVPCINLCGVIIDDNNGYFASGSGTGIATGAIRFSNDNFWTCIPQGTYIVIYNELDINPALPPMDVDKFDGNCRLVIPANSNLLEGTSVSPSNGVPTYPPNSDWVAGTGTWSQVAMSNSNDSFQIPNLNVNGTPLHAVSWGNNTTNAIIYFSGSAGSKVFSFTNNTSNDWNTQANWTAGDVGINETPGAANNPANDAWIASMNPLCGIGSGLNVTVQTTNISCGGNCNGTATAQVSGGTAPYTYLWGNGVTASSLSGLCAGTYDVTVTDAGGCSFAAQGTVQNGGGGLQLNFATTPETCIGNCDAEVSVTVSGGTQPYQILWSNGVVGDSNPDICPGTYSVDILDQNGCSGNASIVVAGGSPIGDAIILPAGPFSTNDDAAVLQSVTNTGTWLTADCSGCLTTDGVFNPSVSGAGTFQICHTVTNGSCQANDCISITVTQGCSEQLTQQTLAFCTGDSVFVFGNWENMPGIYSATYTDIGGCDSVHQVTLIVQQCETQELSLFVPNTFTPNGDQINDFFKIELLGAELEEGYIFNRWGNQVKEFSASELTWDGKNESGELVQGGVYTYLFYYTPAGGSRRTVHGFVTVIR